MRRWGNQYVVCPRLTDCQRPSFRRKPESNLLVPAFNDSGPIFAFAIFARHFHSAFQVKRLLPPWKGPLIMPTTIQLHRVLRAPPERIYRAFLDPDAVAKWFPPNGFTCKVQHLDASIGGTYQMSFTNFSTGRIESFSGKYLELVPNERIRNTDTFDDPNLPGEMQTMVSLKPVSLGTELSIVQEGIPEAIPPEACHLGWQESLILLAKLVEAEVHE